jgi:hypothetical protein
MAIDTLGHLLALHVTAANLQDWSQVPQLAEQVQEVTGDAVEIASVDYGHKPPMMLRPTACNSKW